LTPPIDGAGGGGGPGGGGGGGGIMVNVIIQATEFSFPSLLHYPENELPDVNLLVSPGSKMTENI